MQLDPRIRRSILRALARDRHAAVSGAALAEEVGADADLVQAYADVMEGAGEVWVTRSIGTH
jgi:hypothetical protein